VLAYLKQFNETGTRFSKVICGDLVLEKSANSPGIFPGPLRRRRPVAMRIVITGNSPS
jgi:hypothetical protein